MNGPSMVVTLDHFLSLATTILLYLGMACAQVEPMCWSFETSEVPECEQFDFPGLTHSSARLRDRGREVRCSRCPGADGQLHHQALI